MDKVCESKQYSQLSGEIFYKSSQLFHILVFNISIVCFLPCYLPMNKIVFMEKISDRLWVLLYREQYQSLLNIWTESRSTDEIFSLHFRTSKFFSCINPIVRGVCLDSQYNKKTVSPNPPWYFSRVISSMTGHSAPNCHFSLTSDLVVLSFSDINQHKRDWQRRAWFWAPWWGWFGKNPR